MSAVPKGDSYLANASAEVLLSKNVTLDQSDHMWTFGGHANAS